MKQEELSFLFANACYAMSIANGLGVDEAHFVIDGVRNGFIDKSGFVKDACALSGLTCNKTVDTGPHDVRDAKFVILELDGGSHFCRLLSAPDFVIVGNYSDAYDVYDPSRSSRTHVITGLRVFR